MTYLGEPGEIELVAFELGDPETDWFVQEYGGGIMIADSIAGHTFIPAKQLDSYECLQFVSRAAERPKGTDDPPREA